MTTRTHGIRESRFRRKATPPAECDHVWEDDPDGMGYRGCLLCDAYEEAPEPDAPAEDGE